MTFVLLSFPDVKPINHALLVDALNARELSYLHILPSEIEIHQCSPSRSSVSPDLNRPAVVLHRTVMRHRTVVKLALSIWEADGVCVLNEFEASERSRNKAETTQVLSACGIAAAPSLVLSYESLLEGEIPWKYPWVAKPLMGASGIGVILVEHELQRTDRVENALRESRFAQFRETDCWIVQPLIGEPGMDFRAFVVGGKCVAAMQRRSKPGEWRANVALGASCEPLDQSSGPIFGLAENAVNALGLDFGSVDILQTATGELVVNEVDAWGGFAAIQAVTEVDVAGSIVDLALKRLDDSDG